MKILANIILLFVMMNNDADSQKSEGRKISYSDYIKFGGLPISGRLRNGTNHWYTVDKNNRTQKIVGGTIANKCDGPWTVAILNWGYLRCGGSILDEYNILTAAHCLDGLSASDIQILYDTLNIDTGGTLIQALNLIIHKDYDPFNIDNDIGIIQLKSPINLNGRGAKRIKLPSKESDPIGNAIVIGWGATSEGGDISYDLLKVKVPIVDRATCAKDYYDPYDNTSLITNNMICAGREGKDSCQGDSGGPLTQKRTLIGIVSWGYGCAREGYPGVYTRVSKYIKWIKRNRADF